MTLENDIVKMKNILEQKQHSQFTDYLYPVMKNDITRIYELTDLEFDNAFKYPRVLTVEIL